MLFRRSSEFINLPTSNDPANDFETMNGKKMFNEKLKSGNGGYDVREEN